MTKKDPPTKSNLSHMNSIHSFTLISVRYMLILSSHPRLSAPGDSFPIRFLTNILYAFILCVLHTALISPVFELFDHRNNGEVKVVPVLNEAPHHEDVLEDGGIAPRTLSLSAR